MDLKTITAAMLLLSAPSFAAGKCIVCPPGYDCSTGTPALDGTTGQVLTRTENGAEWQAMPAMPSPYTSPPAALGATGAAGISTNYAREDHVHRLPTAAEVGAVPNTRTVNNKALSGNITISASDVSGVPTSRTVAGLPLSGDITAQQLRTALGF